METKTLQTVERLRTLRYLPVIAARTLTEMTQFPTLTMTVMDGYLNEKSPPSEILETL
jgi:hypothetical protein